MSSSTSTRVTATRLPDAMRFRYLAQESKLSVEVAASPINRRGLFCKRDLYANEMIIEYAGEIIRSSVNECRERKYAKMGIEECYSFRIDDQVIDATKMGNRARFINHCCDPNCYAKVIECNHKKHIVIIAKHEISAGSELTYDYKFPYEEVKIPCHCGVRRCRKYLN